MRPELCRYTFRRLASTELSLVNDLYNKIYHCNRSGAQAEWLYRHNPYGEPLIIGAFDSSGQLVGMRPAIASRLFWRGLQKPAYQFIDALVAPQHRNKGIFTHLVNLMCTLTRENNVATFSFSNDASASAYRKTALLSFLGRCETYVKVLSWPRYLGYQLRRELGRDGHGADIHIQEDSPTELDGGVSDGDMCLSPISRFDSDYEEVHAALGRIVPSFTLRRKEFLNWRFFGSAERQYRVAVIQQSGRTQGYVAVRMIGPIAHLIDLFIVPDVWVDGRVARLVSQWATELGAIAVHFNASEGNFFRGAFPLKVPVSRRAKTPNIFVDSTTVRYLASLQGRRVTLGDFYFVTGDRDSI